MFNFVGYLNYYQSLHVECFCQEIKPLQIFICLTAPCQDDEFSCEAEKRCIGEKLVCDGTKQCQDGLDEKYCNSKLLRHATTLPC